MAAKPRPLGYCRLHLSLLREAVVVPESSISSPNGVVSPLLVVSDNRTEFTANVMLRSPQDQRVARHRIAPHKPTQNGLVESVVRHLRDECLNEHMVTSYRYAPEIIDNCRTALQCQKTTHKHQPTQIHGVRNPVRSGLYGVTAN